jgi:hypothetical protein
LIAGRFLVYNEVIQEKMNPHLVSLLSQVDEVMASDAHPNGQYRGAVHVGVDLGTAYTVLMVLDDDKKPLAGAFRFAQVVRDGLVVDFNGAGGLEWSGPAQYVKLREDLYLFNWLEEACNGTLGVLVINTRTMHDCGLDYHSVRRYWNFYGRQLCLRIRDWQRNSWDFRIK